MRRTLSSSQTFVFKYVSPVLWSALFGFLTIGLWLGVVHGRPADPPQPWMPWLFLIIWVAGTAIHIWFSRRVKRVQMDDHALYVSNYFSESSVPLSEIADFTETTWTRPSIVTIHFRTRTPAGSRVAFIPKSRFFGFAPHPVIAELRTLSDREKAE